MSDEAAVNKKGLHLGRNIRRFLWTLAGGDAAQFALRTRGGMEHLFILTTMGNMLGIPVPMSYYSLRLLPHVASRIGAWKRWMLRERDFTDTLVSECL